MQSVSVSQFRANPSKLIAAARTAPVEITDTDSSAVLVSPDFFERALKALEDQVDIAAAEEARTEITRISHEELLTELGF